MSFLMDTDICSAALKGVGVVGNRLLQYTGRLYVSTICVAELFTWASRRNASARRRQGLRRLLSETIILPVDEPVAQRAGELRAFLLDEGSPTAVTDLLIASTALEHDLTLVTHNLRHFNTIPDLHLEDWLNV